VKTLAVCALLFGVVLSVPAAQASPVSIQNVRKWQAPDYTRLVFDLSGPVEQKVFALHNPERVVIDLQSAHLNQPLPRLQFDGPVVDSLRSAAHGSDLRVVVDLKKAALTNAFVLKPYGQYGYRLVIDFKHDDVGTETAEAKPAPEPTTPSPAAPKRDVIIAVDAGHGGDDPGATGRRYRTHEKDVVLAIAKDLARRIDREPGMRAYLTRRGDYFVGLAERRELAKRHHADLFVSIHADSLPGSHARGSSVYALSQRGATSVQARALANRENTSDLIGGIDVGREDPVLNTTLADLIITYTVKSSLELGRDILSHLRPVGHIHVGKVDQAAFAVLKLGKIPSVLVETAFLSNPADEKLLRTRSYQRRLATGIFKGIRQYVHHSGLRPRGTATVTASGRSRFHVVQRGETLSGIAHRYHLKVDTLRVANGLRGDTVMAGARLRIP
jgi:N-acetylmuramoyl-L-alanine amidase